MGLISNGILKVLVSLQNDGTALKSSIQFDEQQHLNVRLNAPVPYNFVAANPTPSPDFLKSNLVCEANISYVSTMDDCMSLPVSATYKTRYNKSGEDMK